MQIKQYLRQISFHRIEFRISIIDIMKNCIQICCISLEKNVQTHYIDVFLFSLNKENIIEADIVFFKFLSSDSKGIKKF